MESWSKAAFENPENLPKNTMIQPSNITAAIAHVRSKGIVCIKTARNTGINSLYASYADVWDSLRAALDEAALSVGFIPGSVRKEGDAWIQRLTIAVTFGNESQFHEFECLFPEGNRGVNITQRQGMAHTYAKRYALIDFFHIITGDDDDAVRLGMERAAEQAPSPSQEAHWSEFCHVPLADIGSEETARAWTVLADPSDPNGQRTLGDSAPAALAKAWIRARDNPGLNAWRAELIQERAAGRALHDWTAIRRDFPALKLPEQMAQCTPEQLADLALALTK